MSHTFTISGVFPPDYDDVMDGLPVHDVEPDAGQEEVDGGPWPEGVRHYHRMDVSTRGVEVSWEDGQFAVRINTLAAPEDYDLAFHFLEVVADILGNPIESEDGTTLPASQLRDTYDDDWVRSTNEGGCRALQAMFDSKEEDYDCLQIPGAVRTVHIGRRVWSDLKASGPDDEFLDRVMAFLRHVQWIDQHEPYYAAETMAFSSQEDDEKKVTFAVFAPEVGYLFPEVEYLLLPIDEEGKEQLFVPFDSLPELIPAENWRWLDERQVLVEPVPPEQWSTVIEQARDFAVEDPLGEE